MVRCSRRRESQPHRSALISMRRNIRGKRNIYSKMRVSRRRFMERLQQALQLLGRRCTFHCPVTNVRREEAVRRRSWYQLRAGRIVK